MVFQLTWVALVDCVSLTYLCLQGFNTIGQLHVTSCPFFVYARSYVVNGLATSVSVRLFFCTQWWRILPRVVQSSVLKVMLEKFWLPMAESLAVCMADAIRLITCGISCCADTVTDSLHLYTCACK